MVRVRVARSSRSDTCNMVDLSKLTVEDLRKLQAEAQAQIELKERKPGRSRLLQDWHSALATVFKAEEGQALPPFPIWQRLQPATRLKPNLVTAEDAVRGLFKKKPTRNELPDGREFVISMAMVYVREALKLPVSMNVIGSNLGNVSTVLEFSFPNYRRSGLAWMGFKMWRQARASGVWSP